MRVAQLVVLFAVALALPSLLIPLGLPAEGDAVDYRIPLVRWILRHGQYPNWPWSMVDDYPMLGELLMVPLYWLSPALARLVPIGAFLGLGWAGGRLAMKMAGGGLLSKRALFWVGFAWILNLRPLALQSNLLMIDNLASAFLLSSLVFLLERRFKVAGALLAGALATRYTTWGTAAFFPIFVFLLSDRKLAIRNILWLCVLAGLGAMPFMVRNFFVNDGAIFFPIGNAEAMRSVAVNNYGRGSDLISLLLIPYDLLYTNTFVRGFYDYTIGKLFYVQLLFALPFFLWLPKRIYVFDKQKAVLCLFFFVHLIFWFKSGQQLRFLVPSLVVLNLAMLAVLVHGRIAIIMALTALSVLSAWSIQKDSLQMVFRGQPTIFAEARERAEECFGHAGIGGDAVGYVDRDGVLGFFDRDFYFLRPNPFAISGGLREAPLWIYSMEHRDGYELFPSQKPCLLKKI